MLIAQISDTHIDPENPKGARRLGDFERVVADINALDPLPDLVVHTGDLAHNGNAEKYRLAEGILAGLRCPFLPVAGNRDAPDLLRRFFPPAEPIRPEAGFFQYAVEGFPVRLLILDTRHAAGNQGDFCEERADTLKVVLDARPDRPTALFMHHPPFEIPESTYPRQFEDWAAAERLTDVVASRANVIHLFCGHAHRDTRGKVAGVPAGCVPSVAVDLRLGDFAAGLEDTPLYQLHRFDGRGFTTELRAARPLDHEAAAD